MDILTNDNLESFIERMMCKIVGFYNKKVETEFEGKGYDTDEESFIRALNIVTSTAFVVADVSYNRLFLYALDPMAFLPVNTSGRCELWDFLQNWANKEGITLGISKFKTSLRRGKEIYQYTKDFLLSTKMMVEDDTMTFEDAFLKD